VSTGQRKVTYLAIIIQDALKPRVTQDNGTIPNMPHPYYVNNGDYIKVYDRDCIKQALATSIKAIVLLSGDSNTSQHQDPVSFDKMVELLTSYQL